MRAMVIASAMFLSTLSIAVATDARAAIRMPTDIRAQGLGPALQALAKAREFQIVYRPEYVRDRTTGGAAGDLTRDEALTRILADTGLSFRYLNENTVTVEPFAAGSDAPAAAPAASPTGPQQTIELEEIVVTGTNIRGRAPVGASVTVISQEQILRSGHGRVQDVLAQQSQNSAVVNEAQSGRFNRNSEVQLRGLGAGTTLLLVNGQRQPLGASGVVSDISSIPASAVERIEILADGASALYGSDAIGGVVNFILRRDFDGLETRVRGSTAAGDADELQAGILFGKSWSSGNFMIGYDAYHHDALFARDRAYTAANGDLRAFGGSNFRGNQSNPGTIINSPCGGGSAAIPAGQDGTNLTCANLVAGTSNGTNYAPYYTITPEQDVQSVFLSGHIDLSSAWRLLVNGRYAEREFLASTRSERRNVTVPATNAFNRFGVPVVVAYDFGEDLGAVSSEGNTTTYTLTAGLEGELPNGWTLTVNGNWAHEDDAFNLFNLLNAGRLNGLLASSDPNVALNVFGDGSQTNPATLAQLRNSLQDTITRWDSYTANALATGSLFQLPAGAAVAAFGVDYRQEYLDTVDGFSGGVRGNADRSVRSVFGEITLPLFGSDQPGAGNSVELSLAGRYDDYSDIGDTFNPKVGLTWQVTNGLALRGTWGTSFRAPPFALSDPQYQPPFYLTDTVIDPASPSGFANVITLGGVVPDLQEETAETWSAGFDFEVPSIPRLTISATYFRIDYTDRIETAGDYSGFLAQEGIFASVIQRNPSSSQISALCNDPNFFGDCSDPASITAILDVRMRNVAAIVTDGIDFNVGYGFASEWGDWTAGLRGTRMLNYETRIISGAAKNDIVGTLERVPGLRLAAEIGWKRERLSAGARVSYLSDSNDPTFAPARRIDSWTTLDASFSYDFSPGEQSGTRLYLNINNVLDEEPPFVNRNYPNLPYDVTNANLLGRQLSLQVVTQW